MALAVMHTIEFTLTWAAPARPEFLQSEITEDQTTPGQFSQGPR
ncbi:MAG: hypothetical protein JWO04_3649 [Gammaproteobacteria bacterium]|nr:hypothetical protein [Gammaproteobacteria bacterium]